MMQEQAKQAPSAQKISVTSCSLAWLLFQEEDVLLSLVTTLVLVYVAVLPVRTTVALGIRTSSLHYVGPMNSINKCSSSFYNSFSVCIFCFFGPTAVTGWRSVKSPFQVPED